MDKPARRKPTSTTPRSLAKLRADGWLAGTVEKFVRFPTPHRVDLFGCVDIVAVRGDEVLFVQSCRDADASTRLNKAKALPEFHKIAKRFEVWGWGMKGAAGKRKLWTLRILSAKEMVDADCVERVSDGNGRSEVALGDDCDGA